MTLEMTNTPKQKPLHEVRFGNIQVSVWTNQTRDGETFHSFVLRRSYRDQKGEWQDQRVSLRASEVAKVTGALEKALADYYTLPELRDAPEGTDSAPGNGGGQ